jgi:hypothetical protein
MDSGKRESAMAHGAYSSGNCSGFAPDSLFIPTYYAGKPCNGTNVKTFMIYDVGFMICKS